MKWSQCFTSLADQHVSLPRFGHSAVAVNATQPALEWHSLPPLSGQRGDLVVVFGGVGSPAGDAAQTALGDVVVLQVDSGTWSAPDILQGSSPGARAFHSAVSIGRSMLMFGGHILTFDGEHNRKRRCFFNDVWQLDTDEWQWSRLTVSASSALPPGRDMAALLLLDESTLLLFGGRSEQGKSLQDTWLFDVNKRCWQQLKPEGPLPPPRKMHSMVKLGAQVVMFGGERDNGPLDDLWVLRGYSQGETPRWTHIKMRVSPAPRFGHTMVTVSPAAAVPSDTGVGSSGGGAEAAAASTAATVDSSGGAAAAAAAGAGCERVVLFGGCLDLSSFLSLNRNYVQSKETWLLDLNALTWLQVPVADGGAGTPCERMCHSMTQLPDGRVLLLGGRHKEGICRDLWWLDPAGELPVPPSPSASAATGAAQQASPSSTIQSAAAASPGRTGSQQSLLQSLLNPMRQRDTSQGQLQQQQPAAAASTTSTATSVSDTLSQPASPLVHQQQQQHQQHRTDAFQQQIDAQRGAFGTAAGADGTAAAFQSSSAVQQQQQYAGLDSTPSAGWPSSSLPPPYPGAVPPPPLPPAAATGSSSASQSAWPAYPAAAAAGPPPPSGVGSGVGLISSQPLAALMDVGSGELAKLIKNPYSAGAINKLSSSVTSTMTSLLTVGEEGQPGSLAGALPAALSRVAPGLLPGSSLGPRVNSSGAINNQQQPGVANPAMAALRAQMGLPPVAPPGLTVGSHVGSGAAAVGAAGGPFMAPGAVLQELAVLGQQLLGDDNNNGSAGHAAAGVSSGGSSFTASTSIPPDVLVSAARQHLMSGVVDQLQLQQVALLLADYQHLAAAYYEQQMLSRLSEGFAAAVSSSERASSLFLQRQPFELLLGQVQQLQSEYKQLLMETLA